MKSFLFVATAVACVSSAASAGVIYSTGFNASEGYVVGNLEGQQGWTTYQPSTGTGSPVASITADGRMQMNSGTSGAESGRYAWHGNYGAQFDVERAAGQAETIHGLNQQSEKLVVHPHPFPVGIFIYVSDIAVGLRDAV